MLTLDLGFSGEIDHLAQAFYENRNVSTFSSLSADKNHQLYIKTNTKLVKK